MSNKLHAVFLAFLAAVFYAINTPLSKILLGEVPATYMAGFLYFGAGIGMSVLFAATGSYHTDNKLIKSDFPYVLGMVMVIGSAWRMDMKNCELEYEKIQPYLLRVVYYVAYFNRIMKIKTAVTEGNNIDKSNIIQDEKKNNIVVVDEIRFSIYRN